MLLVYLTEPSVLWCCWLGSRKGIRHVKNWVVGYWHGYLFGARCRLAYGPADATATHCLFFSKIHIGFTFLVPAHPGSPGQRLLNRCVCVFNYVTSLLQWAAGYASRNFLVPVYPKPGQIGIGVAGRASGVKMGGDDGAGAPIVWIGWRPDGLSVRLPLFSFPAT